VVERQLLVQYRAGTGEAWLLSSLPAGLTGAANTQFGDSVCSVGGWNETARAASGAVLCWNPLSRAGGQQSWVAVSSMPSPRFRPAAAVMDGKLYVAGGYSPARHAFLSTMEVFDDVSAKWYGLPDMRHPRAGLGLAALQGKLYAAGGWRDRQYSRAVERFDPLTDRWTDLPGLQERRGKLGLASLGGLLYAVGGVSGFRPTDQLDSIERYDPNKERWELVGGRMSVIRGPVSVALVDTD